MKELPTKVMLVILAISLALIVFLVFQLRGNSYVNQGPALDELGIETGNPQPAGQNTVPSN